MGTQTLGFRFMKAFQEIPLDIEILYPIIRQQREEKERQARALEMEKQLLKEMKKQKQVKKQLEYKKRQVNEAGFSRYHGEISQKLICKTMPPNKVYKHLVWTL